jgi:hypothetical protein
VTCARLAKYGYESIEISGEPTQYKVDDVKEILASTACAAGARSP